MWISINWRIESTDKNVLKHIIVRSTVRQIFTNTSRGTTHDTDITFIPWEHKTIDRNSQFPVRRCISSLSPAAWSPPNFTMIICCYNYHRYLIGISYFNTVYDFYCTHQVKVVAADLVATLFMNVSCFILFAVPGWRDVLRKKNELPRQCIFQASYSTNQETESIYLCSGLTPLQRQKENVTVG